MEIEKGLLDSITRPASSPARSKPQTSVLLPAPCTSKSHSTERRRFSTGSFGGSFEILPTEVTATSKDSEGQSSYVYNAWKESTSEDSIPDSELSCKIGEPNQSDTAQNSKKPPNNFDFFLKDRRYADPKFIKAVRKVQKLDQILTRKEQLEKKTKHQTQALIQTLREQLDDLQDVTEFSKSTTDTESCVISMTSSCLQPLQDLNNMETTDELYSWCDSDTAEHPIFQTEPDLSNMQEEVKLNNDKCQEEPHLHSVSFIDNLNQKTTRKKPKNTNIENAEIQLEPGEGYSLLTEHAKSMADIDMKLQHLMHTTDFLMVCDTPGLLSMSENSSLFESSCWERNSTASDNITREEAFTEERVEGYAEQKEDLCSSALSSASVWEEYEAEKEKLKDLDAKLEALVEDSITLNSQRLNRCELDKLLYDCLRMQSEDLQSKVFNEISYNSSLQSLYSNPPSLPESVLQQLLADACKNIIQSEGSRSLSPDSLNDEALNDNTHLPSIHQGVSSGNIRLSHSSSLESMNKLKSCTSMYGSHDFTEHSMTGLQESFKNNSTDYESIVSDEDDSRCSRCTSGDEHGNSNDNDDNKLCFSSGSSTASIEVLYSAETDFESAELQELLTESHAAEIESESYDWLGHGEVLHNTWTM